MTKYVIHVDKLIQSYDYDEAVSNSILDRENDGMLRIGNLVLMRCSIEKDYLHCFQVLGFTNEKTTLLGYLYWGSSNKMLGKIYFKVYNERLYDNTNVDVRAIADALGLKISALPNVDIAVDFNFNVINKIYGLFKNEYLDVIILGKVRGKNEYVKELVNVGMGSLNNPYQNKALYIKGRDSNKLELNAYDKTLEIEQESNKNYITEKEGFLHTYRLEVRSNSVQLDKTLHSLGISQEDFLSCIYNHSMQIKVWEHLFNRLLRFRKHGERQCEKILDLLLTPSNNNMRHQRNYQTDAVQGHGKRHLRHFRHSQSTRYQYGQNSSNYERL